MPGMTAALAAKQLPIAWQTSVDEYVVALDVNVQSCVVAAGAEIRVFDPQTGAVRWTARPHPSVFAVATSPAHGRVVTCGSDGLARMFDGDGRPIAELPSSAAWVEHAAWSSDGELVATAAGRAVRVWTRDGVLCFEGEPMGSTVAAIGWRAGTHELAAAAYGGVRTWAIGPQVSRRDFDWKGSLISLAWSPDGAVIAAGSQDCSVHFWRLRTGRDSEMTGYRFKPRALGWDSRSSMLATAGDAAVTAWDFAGRGPEGKRPLALAGHTEACTQLVFNPRKGVLASAARDGSVLSWEPRRSTRPLRFGLLESEVTALRWHPTGGLLVGADAQGHVIAWNGAP